MVTIDIGGMLKLSARSRRMISRSKLGKKRPPFDEEWRRNLSVSGIGQKRPCSETTKMKISKANKGRKSKFKGIHRKLTIRRKIAATLTGRKLPEGTRVKMRLARQRFLRSSRSKAINAAHSRRMKGNNYRKSYLRKQKRKAS